MTTDQTDGRDYSIYDRAIEARDWMAERAIQISEGMIALAIAAHANQIFQPTTVNAEGSRPNCMSVNPHITNGTSIAEPGHVLVYDGSNLQTGNPINASARNAAGQTESLQILDAHRVDATHDQVLLIGPDGVGLWSVTLSSCGGNTEPNPLIVAKHITRDYFPSVGKNQQQLFFQ